MPSFQNSNLHTVSGSIYFWIPTEFQVWAWDHACLQDNDSSYLSCLQFEYSVLKKGLWLINVG